MRKFFLTAFVLSATLALAASGFALEKTSLRLADDNRADGWNASATCNIIYYNFCSGWVWIWSGWGARDVIGVCYDSCCPPGTASTLVASWQLIWTGSPPGYGFTGTAEVRAGDANCCPTGAPLASQAWLPTTGTGPTWNQFLWGVNVPSRFVVTGTLGAGTGLPNPVVIPTDHPASGTGLCYPATRVNHSFYYGTAGTPLCPGSTLFDGVGNAQWLADASLSCQPVSVEQDTWGGIKSLYR